MNDLLTTLIDELSRSLAPAFAIWLGGGWAMVAIAVTGVVMFGLGLHVQLKLYGKGLQPLRESTWRQWIDHAADRQGPIGEMLEMAMQSTSRQDIVSFFQALQTTEMLPFSRDLRVMKICVSSAPLLGLLGTVTGMLSTFGALASGAGGEKTMGLVASGISEALITTETGLVIALPGLFFHYYLVRRHHRYKGFLTHLETVCVQTLYRKQRPLTFN